MSVSINQQILTFTPVNSNAPITFKVLHNNCDSANINEALFHEATTICIGTENTCEEREQSIQLINALYHQGTKDTLVLLEKNKSSEHSSSNLLRNVSENIGIMEWENLNHSDVQQSENQEKSNLNTLHSDIVEKRHKLYDVMARIAERSKTIIEGIYGKYIKGVPDKEKSLLENQRDAKKNEIDAALAKDKTLCLNPPTEQASLQSEMISAARILFSRVILTSNTTDYEPGFLHSLKDEKSIVIVMEKSTPIHEAKRRRLV